MVIVKQFYGLSLLKINLEKTKAVWIGRNHNSNVKWCENENLDWCKSFKLPGINFDNNLENMDNNFYEKIDKIKRLLNCTVNTIKQVADLFAVGTWQL